VRKRPGFEAVVLSDLTGFLLGLCLDIFKNTMQSEADPELRITVV
jgi:hypothetical protein